MLNIDWMLADGKNFVNFVRVLKTSNSEQIYQVEVINVLLNEFWEENFLKIFWKVLVPWAIFMLCSTWYFMTILVDGYSEGADGEDEVYKYCLSGTILVTLVYQIWIELVESWGDPLLKYFGTFTNWIDIFQVVGTSLILIE